MAMRTSCRQEMLLRVTCSLPTLLLHDERTNAGATALARLGTAPGIGMNRHPNAAERRLCFPGIVY